MLSYHCKVLLDFEQGENRQTQILNMFAALFEHGLFDSNDKEVQMISKGFGDL